MKLVLTQADLLALSAEEVMDLISAKTIDGKIIYLDSIVSLERTQVIMKDGLENMQINSEEAYKSLEDKMFRFKMLSAIGMVGELSQKNQLDKLIDDRLCIIENDLRDSLDSIKNSMRSSLKDIKDTMEQTISSVGQVIHNSVLKELSPGVKMIEQNAKLLETSIMRMRSDISSINMDELNNVTFELTKITSLLSEVIAEEG